MLKGFICFVVYPTSKNVATIFGRKVERYFLMLQM
jgi:hypothetical protein